ncbi:MAG: hypothetical protein CTY16_05085 [Methylobacter sp.]|nr:MAG: hypothetical protein CTY16_05085 [Methylobacter sp.]
MTYPNHPASHDITGLPLYPARFLIQSLKDEESETGTLFESIKKDSRPYNVLLVYKQLATRRSFGGIVE